MDPHVHTWMTMEVVPITKIENKRYKGSAGDKAFLVRVCECDETLAIEYGETKAMKELLKKFDTTLKLKQLELHESSLRQDPT